MTYCYPITYNYPITSFYLQLRKDLLDAFKEAACLSPYLSIVDNSDGIYILFNGYILGRNLEDYIRMESEGLYPSTAGLNALLMEIILPLIGEADLAFQCLRRKVIEIGIPLLENLDDPILKIQWFDILLY